MVRRPPYDSTGIEHYSIPSFTFTGGETLPVTLAYRSFNPSAKRTVLIPTCFRGQINTTLNFAQTTLRDYHVIVVAMFGNGESSSPSNTPGFPKEIRCQDCVKAQYTFVTRHLGIASLDAVIGFSMGGQQAYHWAVMHGSSAEPFVKAIVPICSSARTSPHNIAFLEGPCSALLASNYYHAYRAAKDGGGDAAAAVEEVAATVPKDGLRAFGRAYAAWLTSAPWFHEELWRNVGASSLAEWLDNAGIGYEGWDPEDVIVMVRMWQAGDVGDVGGEGDWRKALKGVVSRVLVMPCRTDQYFTPAQSEREVEVLAKGELAVIESIWGHTGGGGASVVDTKWMEGRIGKFLNS